MATEGKKRGPKPPVTLAAGSVTTLDKVKDKLTATIGARGTMYQPVLDQIAKLKIGEVFMQPIPQGRTAAEIQNGLGGAKRGKVAPPAGGRFRMSPTKDGKFLAIAVIEDKSASKPA